MTLNPHMLTKVRSEDIMSAAGNSNLFPSCTLKLGTFAGIPCAPRSTNVMAHLPTIGKGMSTKVSDVFVACGCATCHSILDEVHEVSHLIQERYPAAYWIQVMKANHETISRLIMAEIISVIDGELI